MGLFGVKIVAIGIAALVAAVGGYMWATRGSAILLDLSWTGCF